MTDVFPMIPSLTASKGQESFLQHEWMFVLFYGPIAVLHANVYWCYSVLHHFYTISVGQRVPELGHPASSSQKKPRLRGLSEPPASASSSPSMRPHDDTFAPLPRRPRSATVDAVIMNNKPPAHRMSTPDPSIVADELLGITRPPAWWQDTKKLFSKPLSRRLKRKLSGKQR